MTPQVSVIMPVYNADRYVEAAVRSILDQTFRDFEFLIVDDGSTDGSLAILQRLAATDGRIRLLSRPNTGYVIALNQMLELARGEFIARMDADDLSEPHRFETQLRRFAADPDLVALSSCYTIIDSDGRRIGYCPLPPDSPSICRQLAAGLNPLCHPGTMLRTEAVRKIGGYRPGYWPAEDFDLWLRLSRIGTLANCAQPLLNYRMHASSTSNQNRRRQADAVVRALQDAGAPIPRPMAEEAVSTAGGGVHVQWNLQWGWSSWNIGENRTAARYAMRALAGSPLCGAAWRLLAVSLLKRSGAAEATGNSGGSLPTAGAGRDGAGLCDR